jgi:16S rRNA C967 or C1407 C5-methylase (RsmB/RsmF family)
VFRVENEAVVDAFLADQPGARRVSCAQQAHASGREPAAGAGQAGATRPGDIDGASGTDLRLLPDPDHDGFHYALLSKP